MKRFSISVEDFWICDGEIGGDFHFLHSSLAVGGLVWRVLKQSRVAAILLFPLVI